MQPPPTRRRRTDVVVVVVLVGVFVVGLTAYGVVGNYLHRVNVAFDSMQRIEAVGAYAGRPSPAPDTGPDNYAVFATNGDGTLAAAFVLHLDASRQGVTVIGVPADMRLPDGSLLASAYGSGPSTATKGLEQLFDAQMSHQFALNLDECVAVMHTIGSINVNGTMDANQVQAYVDAASTPAELASRLSSVTAATLATFTVLGSFTDPDRFDNVLAAITPCVAVDATLTSEDVQSTLVSIKINAQNIGWVLASDDGTSDSTDAVPAVPTSTLSSALANDDFGPIPLARPAAQKG